MLVFEETYEEVTKPALPKELVKFLDTFALKHATDPNKITVKFKPFPHRADYYYAMFYDERFGARDAIGHVRWDFGRRNDFEYEIQSRLITNAKYSHWSREHNTMRTKDLGKTIKAATKYILPWSYKELARETKDAFNRARHKWVEEKSNSAHHMRPALEDMYTELKNLIAQGVTFETSSFKNAVNHLAEYEEWRVRQATPADVSCVLFTPDRVVMMDDRTASEFNSDAEIPEGLRGKLGILKITDNNSFIPEIGYKVDSNTFWIYNETNN